jgi:hypothetical protein
MSERCEKRAPSPRGTKIFPKRCSCVGPIRARTCGCGAFLLGRVRSARFLFTINVPHQKIAVFEFELDDFSAAGQTKSVPETSYLAQATDEAEQQLRASAR